MTIKYLLEYKCDGVHAKDGKGKCDEIFRMGSEKEEWPSITPKMHVPFVLGVGNYICGQFRPYRMWVDTELMHKGLDEIQAKLDSIKKERIDDKTTSAD